MISRSGQLSVGILFFSALAVVLITGFVFLASSFLQLSVRDLNRSQAFAIAEAGIDYYRWHLAHAAKDYQDGTGQPGPYVHDYYDKTGNLIGTFTLDITPPPNGSPVVTIESTGKVTADPSITKIIKVKMTPNTLFQYNIVQDADLVIGTSTIIYGPVASNGGIHFDGYAYNVVKSSQYSYIDSSENGNKTYYAVHTDVPPVDPFPPTPLPTRPDVFAAGRQISAPAIDFQILSQVLANIKTLSQSGGIYVSSSRAFGYDLVFSTSTANASTTYTLYKVTTLASPPNGCTNTKNVSGWGTWSIGTEVFVSSGTIPSNSTFFIEDNVWVRGQINNARLTVGSAVFPDNSATWTSATINNDLRYTNYDGSDSLLVVAQNNVNIGLMSNDVLRIDAGLIAEHGRVGRFYYQPPNNNNNSNKCAPYSTRQSITIYGSIVTEQSYAFGFADSTGYQQRNILYDANLYYNPPSILVPLSAGFNLVSWEEVQ